MVVAVSAVLRPPAAPSAKASRTPTVAFAATTPSSAKVSASPRASSRATTASSRTPPNRPLALNYTPIVRWENFYI